MSFQPATKYNRCVNPGCERYLVSECLQTECGDCRSHMQQFGIADAKSEPQALAFDAQMAASGFQLQPTFEFIAPPSLLGYVIVKPRIKNMHCANKIASLRQILPAENRDRFIYEDMSIKTDELTNFTQAMKKNNFTLFIPAGTQLATLQQILNKATCALFIDSQYNLSALRSLIKFEPFKWYQIAWRRPKPFSIIISESHSAEFVRAMARDPGVVLFFNSCLSYDRAKFLYKEIVRIRGTLGGIEGPARHIQAAFKEGRKEMYIPPDKAR